MEREEEQVMCSPIPGDRGAADQRDQQEDGREDPGATQTPPDQPMAAVRSRYPRPAAVGRRGVVIAIRLPLAVITAPSCNSGLTFRYCSGRLAGPGDPGFAKPSAARQEEYTCSAPATQEPVTGSVGHSGGTGGPIARDRPTDHGDRQDPATQTPATRDRLGSRPTSVGHFAGAAEPAQSLPGVAIRRGVGAGRNAAAAASRATKVQRPLPGPRAGNPALGNGCGRGGF